MSEVLSSGDRNRNVSEGSEGECDPHFSPLITLPEVPITTNEEDEEVMLKLRAKLYRFDMNGDDPEWKERGTGEVKLLKHKENKTVRIVMRRDKTFKVCANHFIMPFMELKPNVGSEKAFVYNVVADFADEKIKSECLAIRFGTVEFANLFKEKFNEAKEFVLKESKLYSEMFNLSDSFIGGSDRENAEESDDDSSRTAELSQKLSELDVHKDEEPSKK